MPPAANYQKRQYSNSNSNTGRNDKDVESAIRGINNNSNISPSSYHHYQNNPPLTRNMYDYHQQFDDQSTELTMDTYEQQQQLQNHSNSPGRRGPRAASGAPLLSSVKNLLTGGGGSSASGNNSQTPIVYSQLPVRNHGTFDRAHYDPLTHPRSQERLTEKWGKLHQRVDTDKLLQNELTAGYQNDGSIDDNMSNAERRQTIQKQIQNQMEYGLGACFLAIAVYVGISILCFSYWLEHWPIVDSIYFAIVTFTTIGYGDLVPDTTHARIFTCVWALSGVACLGIALGVLGSNLIDVAEKDQQKAKDKQRHEVIDMFNKQDGGANNHTNSPARTQDESASQWSGLGPLGMESYDQDDMNNNNNSNNNDYDDNDEEQANRNCFCKCITSPKTRRFVLLFGIMIGILAWMSVIENWYPTTALYYGLITASTVGYGDLYPSSQTGRILAIIYIPIAVGVVGTFLDAIADAIIARKRKATEQYLESKELTLRDLKAMDFDGDGQVTLAEFYEFMLVAMNQVDRDTMDHLRSHFNKLDSDGSGTLDKADLVQMAETKMGMQSANPYAYDPSAKTKEHAALEQELLSRGSSVLDYKRKYQS